jgi:hypothetical protein
MNENVKKISFYIFLSLVFIFIIYMIFLRPNSNTNNKTPKYDPCNRCPDPKSCNPITGECIAPDMCGGVVKPPGDFICKGNNWISKKNISGCENSFLPSNISSCNVNDLRCDHGVFYCPKSTYCNGGNLYFHDNGNNCICLEGSHGPKCEYNDSQCKNEGKMGEDGKCKCNNISFGDKCEYVCDPNKIYDDTAKPPACICDPLLYDIDGDACKKKECGQGILKDGKCVCNPGYSGDDCNKKICNENQIFDEKTNKCVCLANTDGTQYYGDDCKEYNCNLESEFVYDGKTPSCDCSKDLGSCGKYCQFTRENKCNSRGKTNCTDNQFINCKCDSGWTGKNCQCKEDDKPKDTNPCLGIDYVCGDDGTWIEKDLNCNELLSINNYGGMQNWSDQCFKKIFDQNKFKNGKINECEDVTGKTYPNCSKKICAKALGCPTDPDKKCEKGKVLLCDASTYYNWDCKDQVHNDGSCPPEAPGYCIKEDGSYDQPVCFQCGSGGGSEWVCQNQGALPSKQCLSNLGINGSNYIGYTDLIYRNSQNSNNPIYPTTDKNKCLEFITTGADPYYNGQIGGYNVASLYPNPIGTIDSTTFTDLTDNKNRYFNVKSDDLKPRCLLTDDYIVTNILKSTGSLCSGHGTFNQNKDKDGDYYLPSGNCICEDGYIGNNCQYSSKDTCNSGGDPNDDGTCGCKKGYAGKNCQFSRKDCSEHGDPVSSDGKSLTCNCDPEYIGNSCQFSNSDCSKKLDGTSVLTGKASVNNNNLICDYSQTCGVKDDYLRGSCRLLVGTLSGNDSGGKIYDLIPTIIDTTHMTIDINTFSIINTGGFNGVVFSTKPPTACIWSGDNYKINSLIISINNSTINIGVPGTVIGGHGGDEARAVSYYIPISENNKNKYWIRSESKEGGKSKTKLYIYLTMETDDSGWRENQSNSKECCYPQGSC